MSTPNTVLANMNFTVPPSDGSPLYIDLGLAAKGTVPHKNAVEETKQVEIENVRGEEGEYTLDQHGFQFFKSATSVESFTDSERVKREYYPEVQKVLRDVTGAGRIVIFDHSTFLSPLCLESIPTIVSRPSHSSTRRLRRRRQPHKATARLPRTHRPNPRRLHRSRPPKHPRSGSPRPPEETIPTHQSLASHHQHRSRLAFGGVRLPERRSGEGCYAVEVD